MIAITDYGVGNLYSLKSSLDALGIESCVTREESVLRSADKIILPGVGAFSDAAKSLAACSLDTVICDEARAGKPILGICLGMQLFFEKSLEYGTHRGLGLIKGEIVPIPVGDGIKIPHIGWNALSFPKGKPRSPIFRYINEGDFVYFVHSYYASNCAESVSAVTEYGAPITAAVQCGNIFGCQFHPEKSGTVGLAILKAFAEGE